MDQEFFVINHFSKYCKPRRCRTLFKKLPQSKLQPSMLAPLRPRLPRILHFIIPILFVDFVESPVLNNIGSKFIPQDPKENSNTKLTIRFIYLGYIRSFERQTKLYAAFAV